jgi:hypothetical protein
MRRWLKKSTNITKQNLPPFAASGDINDAPFPMPDYAARCLGIHVQSSSAKLRNLFEYDIIARPTDQFFTRVLFNPIPIDDEFTYGRRTPKLEVCDGLSQIFFNRRTSTDSVPRQTLGLPVVSLEIRSTSHNEMQKRRESDSSIRIEDTREESPQYFVKKNQSPTREELDVYRKKFAQLMEENAAQFEQFCLTTTAVARQSGKKERRQQS